MKLGILGTRGIPNAYGGFEQFAEIFSAKMSSRGHQVSVFSSSLHPFQKKDWKGVELIHCYDPENFLGSFGQFIYDFNCFRQLKKNHFDIVLILGYTSSSVWMNMVPEQMVSITNMDGLEWKRSKYSKPVQRFLEKAEKWAALKSDSLIADSSGIQNYLKNKYQKDADFIAYGAEVFEQTNESVLAEFDLEKEEYSLVIARSEPENNIHLICDAYAQLNWNQPLLIIGNFNNKYGQSLQNKYSNKNIRFVGPVYDLEKLNNLRFFSRIYFHGHSVGGTNPSLLEAMASGALICAHKNEFNQSVLGEDALYFNTAEELVDVLQHKPNKSEYTTSIASNLNKIRESYSWDHITDQLENLFNRVLTA